MIVATIGAGVVLLGAMAAAVVARRAHPALEPQRGTNRLPRSSRSCS